MKTRATIHEHEIASRCSLGSGSLSSKPFGFTKNFRANRTQIHQPCARNPVLPPGGNRRRLDFKKTCGVSRSTQAVDNEIRVHTLMLDIAKKFVNSHI